MAGSLIGAAFSQSGLSPGWSVSLTAMLLLIPGWITASQLPIFTEDPEPSSPPKASVSFWPDKALLGISFFTFGVTLTEGAVADWSAVFLRDVHGATGFFAGLGYSAFAAMMTLMRLRGDALKLRFQPQALAQVSCLVALAGTFLVATSPLSGIAIFGFALLGVGSAVGFPLAVSAGGQLQNRPVASSVAFISFVALVGFLIGPVVIGTMAQYFGMRFGIAMLVPALLLSLFLAPQLSSNSR